MCNKWGERIVTISSLSVEQLAAGFTVQFNCNQSRVCIEGGGYTAKRRITRLTVRCVDKKKTKQQEHFLVTETNILKARTGSAKLWVGQGTAVILKK